MIRRAGPLDAPRMEQFLMRYAETSMFLRGNLAAHGTDDTAHPHGTTFYLAERGKTVCGIFGITNSGMLLARTADASPAVFDAFADALKGQNLQGMTGAPDELNRTFDALQCQHVACTLRRIEPLFAQKTSDIDAEAYDQHLLRRPTPQDLGTLKDWFAGYSVETGLAPDGDGNAEQAAAAFIAKPDARVMIVQGALTAMSAFNARTADTVQIGGVYVPPWARGQGFGGGIVARHLLQARDQGIIRAILFAASDVAARAYQRIGFQRIGSYELALFKEPWKVPQ